MKLVTDLFDPEPPRWGLRGDPWVWRAMCEQLTGTYLPPSVGEAERLLKATFDRVVGVDLATEAAPWVYREEFAHGGMSSGNVHLEMWRSELLPTLVDRARSQIGG
ncbi:hypothetical protein [Actinoplanes sp. URMC 104]|uniref:hypothetical protein n=1 Tax=Actinoplanes sp. URMC 104 TaxID=3423409 RepID=UPI003F1BCAEC